MGESPPRDDLDSWSDGELVSLAQVRITGRKGRAWAAFEILYRRHIDETHKTIYRFLVRRYVLADNDLAGQLTQEAFLKAWEGLPTKTSPAPFERWIKRVGINEAQQYMRKREHEQSLPEDQALPSTLSDQFQEDDMERLLLVAELHDRIEHVKTCLSERERLVFRMHYEEGHSLQEIAKKLKRKPATIWQTLWRANVTFRNEWLKEVESDDVPQPALKPQKGGMPGASDEP